MGKRVLQFLLHVASLFSQHKVVYLDKISHFTSTTAFFFLCPRAFFNAGAKDACGSHQAYTCMQIWKCERMNNPLQGNLTNGEWKPVNKFSWPLFLGQQFWGSFIIFHRTTIGHGDQLESTPLLWLSLLCFILSNPHSLPVPKITSSNLFSTSPCLRLGFLGEIPSSNYHCMCQLLL